MNSDFPTADRIPFDKLKEIYTLLHFAYRDLAGEKEGLLESLRQETLNNEEQKNYIEILKQTIESSIVRHGLEQFFKSQKFLYYKNNIFYLGVILYNFYIIFVILASLILLSAMFGVIILTVDFEYRFFFKKSFFIHSFQRLSQGFSF